MIEETDPKKFLNNWLEENQNTIHQLKIKMWVTANEPVDLEKYPAYIDSESQFKMGRLTLWNTGDAETEIFDSNTGERTFVDSRVLISQTELATLLDIFIRKSSD